MAQAAYKATVSASSSPVAEKGILTKKIGSGNHTFAISLLNKRILDPTVTPVLKENGLTISASLYTVDYLFGQFSFNDGNPRAHIPTIDATYIPTTKVIGANSYTIDWGGDILDDTSFDKTNTNGGTRTRTYGLHDVSVSLERFYDLAKTFSTAKVGRNKVLIDIAPGGGAEHARGWFLLESDNLSGDVGSLETESLTFQLVSSDLTSFSWKTE